MKTFGLNPKNLIELFGHLSFFQINLPPLKLNSSQKQIVGIFKVNDYVSNSMSDF